MDTIMLTPNQRPWTDEEIELVKKMALDGNSSTVIAAALQGRTRNSVIGVMHRRGIGHNSTGPKTTVRAQKAKPERRISLKKLFMTSSKAEEEPKQNVPPPEPPDPKTNVRFLERRYNQCKFIVGKKGNTHYCCGAEATRRGWCAYHASIVFRPMDQQPRHRDGGGDKRKTLHGPSR